MADISILQVAKDLGLELLERTLNRIEVQANCPFCGDRHYHLYLNTNDNKWICQRCRLGDKGAVSLYAKVKNMDNEDAYNEIARKTDIFVSDSKKKILRQFELKPLDYRHEVYLHFLSQLHLSSSHRADLKRRGLSGEIIKGNMYKTVPLEYATRYRIIDNLLKRFDLEGIPGFFYSEKEREWRMSARAGFFIPVCNRDNQIQGLQIRLNDESDKKYRWFSSSKYDNGCAAKGWVHVVGDTNSDTVRLTEGPLKSDIASFLSKGNLFVAVPGVNSLSYLPDTLKTLSATDILDCMDMDKLTNKHVKRGVIKIQQMAKRQGNTYSSYRWDSSFKGIDDFLLYKQQNYKQVA